MVAVVRAVVVLALAGGLLSAQPPQTPAFDVALVNFNLRNRRHR
jgi:hypothetical protein